MNTAINNSDKNMSICIPRAFENISENRVRNVFDKLGIFTIDRVDVVLRKNEKGESYKRFFVHVKDWAQTSDAQKAKERLLAGKELKVVYDDPWFWKVGLNTWAPKQQQQPLLNDRKPRIRIEFDEETDKNVRAATNLLSNISLEERDRRPYSERRLDPAYCDQDVKQGFRDRRLPKENRDIKSRYGSPVIREDQRIKITPENVEKYIGSQIVFKNREGNENTTVILGVSKNKKTIHVDFPELQNNLQIVTRNVFLKKEATKLIEPVITAPKPQEKPAFVMNPDIRLMVATYHGIGRDDVTEELYKNTSQFVRDLRQDDMDRQHDEDAELGLKPLNYKAAPAIPPKRNRGKILEEKN